MCNSNKFKYGRTYERSTERARNKCDTGGGERANGCGQFTGNPRGAAAAAKSSAAPTAATLSPPSPLPRHRSSPQLAQQPLRCAGADDDDRCVFLSAVVAGIPIPVPRYNVVIRLTRDTQLMLSYLHKTFLNIFFLPRDFNATQNAETTFFGQTIFSVFFFF